MEKRADRDNIVGSIIITAAFRRHLQPAAIVAALASMPGFVVLALVDGEYGVKLQKIVLIDIATSAALVAAALLRWRKGKASATRT